MTVIEQPHPLEPDRQADRLADLCDTNARRLEQLAEQWRAQARQLRTGPPVDPWTTVMVDELVPGDRIITGGVEVEVIASARWGSAVLVSADMPQTHGGTAPTTLHWPATCAVQCRSDLHDRLTAEWTSEQDLADRAHAVEGVS